MRALRIATVFVPSLLAVVLAVQAGSSHIHTAGVVLLELWIVMAGALVLRTYHEGAAGRGVWRHLDVLTATGRLTMWSSLAALLLAFYTGWASLSVLALFGLGATCLTVTWMAIAAGGEEPWRAATITRKILPATSNEGDALREEVEVAGVKIAVGMQLFATGRASRFGRITRYTVGAEAHRSELTLSSDLGLATRGEHHAPALKLWLGDVLGLTRTPIVERGETTYRVLPRATKVEGVRELLGARKDDLDSRPALRMPTEGTFRIREYAPGDDTRRIHWVRSLQANQLVVRLPDEIPPADPVVRLVLDTYFANADGFTCRATAELLDAMVRVWLGVGKALVDSGVRVTLVTAVEKNGAWVRSERPLHERALSGASPAADGGARLGARAAWQSSMKLDELLQTNRRPGPDSGARQVVVSCRPRQLDRPSEHAWIIVPHNGWTSPQEWPPQPSYVKLPFANGSSENRVSHRRRDRLRVIAAWNDRLLFSNLCWIDWKTFSGELVARPKVDGVQLQVIP